MTAPSNSPENYPAWPGNGEFFDEVSGISLTARTMAAGPDDGHAHHPRCVRRVHRSGHGAQRRQCAGRRRARRARETGPESDRQDTGSCRSGWKTGTISSRSTGISRGLWGLYPGSEITPERTPALAAAAAVTLDRRGTGGCGWSYAWKMGLRARLYDGEKSLEQFRALLTKSSLPNLFSLCGRALQVDGNLGAYGGHRGNAGAVASGCDSSAACAARRVAGWQRARPAGAWRV